MKLSLGRSYRWLTLGSALVLSSFAAGCTTDVGSDSDDITQVNHTDVERQSIGNCWLYAQASWVESMHLSATGTSFDISQSYWTYWHWYGQVTGHMWDAEISTGGNQWNSNEIIRERGLLAETDFVPEDVTGEMSNRQSAALAQINQELKEGGRLATQAARNDGAIVRQIFDEAWGLSPEVRAQLDAAFGVDGATTLEQGGSVEGTKILDPATFAVDYTVRNAAADTTTVKSTNLLEAMTEWRDASYPSWGGDLATQRRNFLIRTQRALHDGQPVVITWDVDFNAMENGSGPLQGSFNLTTLANAGVAGSQGGHMTVLSDYEAETVEFGLLKAGELIDGSTEEGAAKLDALLEPSTVVKFLRIKNSWGSLRPDREFAPGFPGYHDLYMGYLDGPIAWCPDVTNKTATNCTGTSTPLSKVMLPPGY